MTGRHRGGLAVGGEQRASRPGARQPGREPARGRRRGSPLSGRLAERPWPRKSWRPTGRRRLAGRRRPSWQAGAPRRDGRRRSPSEPGGQTNSGLPRRVPRTSAFPGSDTPGSGMPAQRPLPPTGVRSSGAPRRDGPAGPADQEAAPTGCRRHQAQSGGCASGGPVPARRGRRTGRPRTRSKCRHADAHRRRRAAAWPGSSLAAVTPCRRVTRRAGNRLQERRTAVDRRIPRGPELARD